MPQPRIFYVELPENWKYHLKPLWWYKAVPTKAAENGFKLLSWCEWVPFKVEKESIFLSPVYPPTVVPISNLLLCSCGLKVFTGVQNYKQRCSKIYSNLQFIVHWTSRTSSIWVKHFELIKNLPLFWARRNLIASGKREQLFRARFTQIRAWLVMCKALSKRNRGL
jgi:hypothetical protein